MAKKRLNVDQKMYDLADELLHGRFIEADAQEDAIWELADLFQKAYESFCEEHELSVEGYRP